MPTIRSDAATQVLDYIDSLPEWSKKICTRLRDIILNADPRIVEDWKWGPNYNYNGMLCGYGAFQKHVKLTFYNGSAMNDSRELFNHCVDNDFLRSIKFTDISEVDEKALTACIKESVAVNAKGFKRTLTGKTIEVPEDLQQALSGNETARKFFEGLSYGYKKEFVEHVCSAKREQTRLERIGKVLEYCADGRRLNDKYRV